MHRKWTLDANGSPPIFLLPLLEVSHGAHPTLLHPDDIVIALCFTCTKVDPAKDEVKKYKLFISPLPKRRQFNSKRKAMQFLVRLT